MNTTDTSRLRPFDTLHPDQLAARLGFPVYFQTHSRSTQLDAKQGVAQGNTSPALYLAPTQTAAKGRFDRPFYADPSGGIYMSLVLPVETSSAELPRYTILLAAAIVKAIYLLTQKIVSIKWVNDLYFQEKKIAGILTEAIASPETGQITHLVMGVGMNVHIDLQRIPSELQGKVGNLFDQTPSVSRQDLIAEIWRLFLETPAEDLISLYRTHSLVLGQEVSFTLQGQTYTGIAQSISDQGELNVVLSDGQKKTLSSGEVSLTTWSSDPTAQ